MKNLFTNRTTINNFTVGPRNSILEKFRTITHDSANFQKTGLKTNTSKLGTKIERKEKENSLDNILVLDFN